MREKFVLNVQVKSISVLFTRNPYKEQLEHLEKEGREVYGCIKRRDLVECFVKYKDSSSVFYMVIDIVG